MLPELEQAKSWFASLRFLFFYNRILCVIKKKAKETYWDMLLLGLSMVWLPDGNAQLLRLPVGTLHFSGTHRQGQEVLLVATVWRMSPEEWACKCLTLNSSGSKNKLLWRAHCLITQAPATFFTRPTECGRELRRDKHRRNGSAKEWLQGPVRRRYYLPNSSAGV